MVSVNCPKTIHTLETLVTHYTSQHDTKHSRAKTTEHFGVQCANEFKVFQPPPGDGCKIELFRISRWNLSHAISPLILLSSLWIICLVF